jgi:hypothetical protein
LLVVSYSPITPKERGPLGSVILAEGDWPKWLGEALASEDELLALLKPCLDETLKIWPMDQMVGDVRKKAPQLVMPIYLSNYQRWHGALLSPLPASMIFRRLVWWI